MLTYILSKTWIVIVQPVETSQTRGKFKVPTVCFPFIGVVLTLQLGIRLLTEFCHRHDYNYGGGRFTNLLRLIFDYGPRL